MVAPHPQSRGLVRAPRADVSTRALGSGGALLFAADSGRQRRINPTGLAIWRQLDGARDEAALARALLAEYEGVNPAQAEAEVARFLAELGAEGFVEAPPPARPAAPPPLAEVTHERAPLELDLSLTGRCNLRCAHCFYAASMARRPDLPGAQWLRFFDELGRLAVQRVCLSGGEVLLRPDLFELLEALVGRNLRLSLLTNGTLLDEGVVARLAAEPLRRRLDSVQVSLDGATAEVHDRLRGPGAFQRALAGLRRLQEAGLPVTARVTVHRHNVEQLPALAALLLDELGLAHFGTNAAAPLGAGHQNAAFIGLSPAQTRRAMDLLAALAARYPGRILASDGPLAALRHYRAMERSRAAGRPLEPWMGTLSACGCVFGKLAVHHDGAIVPCALLAEATLGQINRDPLATVWSEHPTLAQMRSRRRRTMAELPGCAGCAWAPYCNGGCPAHPYQQHHDLERPSELHCYRRFLDEQEGRGV